MYSEYLCNVFVEECTENANHIDFHDVSSLTDHREDLERISPLEFTILELSIGFQECPIAYGGLDRSSTEFIRL